MDPGPYGTDTAGFAAWYQDSHGRVLDLCLSKALSSRVLGTLLPEPGVFDDTQPLAFPGNFPSEAFWFTADAFIQQGGIGLSYGAALEAAFNTEQPVDGDQISFARIRIRADLTTPGSYTITHPYGIEVCNVTAEDIGGNGVGAINLTRDIGIGAPGSYSGALAGDVGPLLRSVNGLYQESNPATGAVELFVGDPNLEEAITGSPFNTNFVRIQGPAGSLESDQCILSGKVLDARPATALNVGHSTYSRTSTGTRIDLFASSSDDAKLCYRESLELIEGTSPCLHTLTGDGNGHFFASNPPSQGLPPFVVLTASDPNQATRPTSLSSHLSDVVKIKTARYSWADRSLTIEAGSSDETAIPDLAAEGYGRLAKTGILQRLSVTELAQPPARVSVKSAAGGMDSEPVTVVGARRRSRRTSFP